MGASSGYGASKPYEIHKHFVLRKHTHLVGIVAEEERNKLAPLIIIDQQGHTALAPAFAQIIEDAESSATYCIVVNTLPP